jgi:hypothetical protein
LAAFMGQLIQLLCLADVHTAYLIHPHRQLFFFSTAKAVKGLSDKTILQGLKPNAPHRLGSAPQRLAAG